MKATRKKNIIRNIRGSLNRFLSIMFIVALGAGFIAGLAAASPDMYDTCDKYTDDFNLFDIDIKSLIGFDAKDLQLIREYGAADSVQPAVVKDLILNRSDGADYTSRVFGIFDPDGNTEINKIDLIEGRLPENPCECVVEFVFGRYSNELVAIGEKLYLSDTNSDYETTCESMKDTELTVVGICRSPMCLSIEGDSTNIGSGTINLNVYTMTSFFTYDYYTDIYLTISGADELNTFYDQYTELINNSVEEIRTLGEGHISSRKNMLISDAEEQISDAESLEETLVSVVSIQNTMSENIVQNIETNDILASVFTGKNPSFSDYLNKTSELYNGTDYGFSSISVIAGDVKKSIENAEELLNSIKESTWIIRTRDDLAGFESYSSNVGKVSALAKIFPVFFFIVALLVALTTMTRLIEEKRLQTGTLKALGYSNFQILSEYLIFSLSASLLGTIIGLSVGFVIFPYAINAAYSMMYTLPALSLKVRWDIAAWVAPVTVISIIFAALMACWNEFRSMPAGLMQPKSPPAGKRICLEHISFIWKRLSFTQKVTFRNLFRYKKRFIMTIVGVAGCSALLLTGFGVKDSVNDIVNKQFGEINKYDMIFGADEPEYIASEGSLNSLLENRELFNSYTAVSQESGKLYTSASKKDLIIFVPSDPEDIEKYQELRDRKSHTKYTLSDKGVIITEKLSEELGIKVGDVITIEDSEGHQGKAAVEAIVENYVSNYVYMTPSVYTELFKSQPRFNIILCLSAVKDPADNNSLLAEVLADSHILYGRSIYTLKDSFSDSIKSINGVIYVLILAAGLLCIVVLYNLINVNICERKKELATLRVLGFYRKETQNYIFRETNILSFLGACAGLIIGIWLHNIVVRTVEVNSVMFGRDIKPVSYLIALAISVVFTLFVNVIMKRQINKTDMVEAMKANE